MIKPTLETKCFACHNEAKAKGGLLLTTTEGILKGGENGEVILGNNQENAAYPSGMCAERVAIWNAGAIYPGVKIKKLAITASSTISKVDQPIGPCGACRQTLSEYEINQKEPFKVIFMGEVGEVIIIESLLSLLPFSFDSSYL